MQSARSAAVKSLSLRGAQRRGNLQILLEQCVLRDIDLWKPEPREIWLKVDACGVCGTDVTEALDGRADFEPFGHEVAGTILEMGIAVRGLSVGQKVVIESASACGECPNCKNVRQELWTNIQSFFYKTSFGFAEEMVAPTICAIPYGGISPAEACVTEPLGVAIDMSRLADIEIGSHVVVSGLGAIGLMALRLAKLSGAGRIYACDVSSAGLRLEMAKRFGADEVICADKIALQEYAFPRPPDRFLVSSPPRTLKTMFDIAAKGAILSFIGIQYGEGANLTFDANEFHFKKLQLRASFASPALYTPRAYELIRTGMVDAAALITHRFPLSQIHTALRTAACDRGSAIKVVVEG